MNQATCVSEAAHCLGPLVLSANSEEEAFDRTRELRNPHLGPIPDPLLRNIVDW